MSGGGLVRVDDPDLWAWLNRLAADKQTTPEAIVEEVLRHARFMVDDTYAGRLLARARVERAREGSATVRADAILRSRFPGAYPHGFPWRSEDEARAALAGVATPATDTEQA